MGEAGTPVLHARGDVCVREHYVYVSTGKRDALLFIIPHSSSHYMVSHYCALYYP